MKIGFVPYYQDKAGANLIRIDYLRQYLDDYIVSSDFTELINCDVVIFHSRINDEELVKDLKEADVKIIFDMTDPHWDFIDYDPSGKSRELLDKIMPYVDVVTVPTDELKYTFLQYRTDKIIKIIPDSINLETHNKVKKHTKKEDFKICWYGSYGNICSIDELARADLERLGLEFKITLTCLYDKGKIEIEPFKNIELVTKEWSEEGTITEILNSDIVINPRYSNWKSYKSNNKTIKAWSLGVPCVEYDFYREIKKFTSIEARNREAKIRLEDVKEFSSKKTAEYLKELCSELTKKPKKKKNKIAVVTAIVGCDDLLRDDQYIDPDCDYIAYMDKPKDSKVWQVREVKYSPFNEPVRQAKMYKVLPHLYFNYEYVLWIDGTVALRAPVGEMIELFLKENDIAIFPHKVRDCVYKEFIVDMNCARHAYDEPLSLREDQRRRYKLEGLPAESGLFECGFILRRQTDEIKILNNEWWSEISVASASDQVPFMYSLYKTGVKVTPMCPGDMYNSKWSNHIPHGTKPDGKGKAVPHYPGEVKKIELDDIKDNDEVFITYLDMPTYHYSKVGKFSYQQTRKVLGIHAKHLLRNQPDKFTVCK